MVVMTCKICNTIQTQMNTNYMAGLSRLTLKTPLATGRLLHGVDPEVGRVEGGGGAAKDFC